MNNINTINRVFSEIKSKLRKSELELIKKYKLPISNLQWNYLVWSVENNDLTMTELAYKMRIQKGTLSNNLKILYKKELIIKTNVNGKMRIEATPKGIEYIKLHQKARKNFNKKLSEMLTKDEFQELIRLGIKINKAIK